MKKRYENGENFLVLKALRFFTENPYEEIYLREFGRKLKISPNSAQRFLNMFLKEKFISEVRRGNLRYFKANLESVTFRHIKISFSLKRIENSGLINGLKDHSSHLVLFGSIAEGLDDNNSDVDLLCIGLNEKSVGVIISQFEKKLSREINYHVFSWTDWKKQAKLNRAFYLDIISKGISLLGDKPIVE
jgi:predicted nucleotidyltransferase